MADSDRTLKLLIELGVIGKEDARAAQQLLRETGGETGHLGRATDELGEKTRRASEHTEKLHISHRALGKVMRLIGRETAPELGHALHGALYGPIGAALAVGYAFEAVRKHIEETNKELDKLGEEAAKPILAHRDLTAGAIEDAAAHRALNEAMASTAAASLAVTEQVAEETAALKRQQETEAAVADAQKAAAIARIKHLMELRTLDPHGQAGLSTDEGAARLADLDEQSDATKQQREIAAKRAEEEIHKRAAQRAIAMRGPANDEVMAAAREDAAAREELRGMKDKEGALGRTGADQKSEQERQAEAAVKKAEENAKLFEHGSWREQVSRLDWIIKEGFDKDKAEAEAAMKRAEAALESARKETGAFAAKYPGADERKKAAADRLKKAEEANKDIIKTEEESADKATAAQQEAAELEHRADLVNGVKGGTRRERLAQAAEQRLHKMAALGGKPGGIDDVVSRGFRAEEWAATGHKLSAQQDTDKQRFEEFMAQFGFGQNFISKAVDMLLRRQISLNAEMKLVHDKVNAALQQTAQGRSNGSANF